MIFYKRFVVDYLKNTNELSLAEHGAYCLMLDYHYSDEKPLPKGEALYRLLRCFTRIEKQAVNRIIALYWTETPDGYINQRAQEEMAHAFEMAVRGRENGKKGGRPAKNPNKTQGVISRLEKTPKNITQNNHSPESRVLTTLYHGKNGDFSVFVDHETGEYSVLEGGQ